MLSLVTLSVLLHLWVSVNAVGQSVMRKFWLYGFFELKKPLKTQYMPDDRGLVFLGFAATLTRLNNAE
jgi:hypothetical protein